MKIVAIEKEVEGVKPEDFKPYLENEARTVFDLQQSGELREIYFRADRDDAVLILECNDLDSAKATLARLPLVQKGLIEFDLIPLKAYPGFGWLFR